MWPSKAKKWSFAEKSIVFHMYNIGAMHRRIMQVMEHARKILGGAYVVIVGVLHEHVARGNFEKITI